MLRSLGHDVAAVSEFQSRSVDRELIDMAYREDRILPVNWGQAEDPRSLLRRTLLRFLIAVELNTRHAYTA